MENRVSLSLQSALHVSSTRDSLFTALIESISGTDLSNGGGISGILGRERKDSNVTAPDVELETEREFMLTAANKNGSEVGHSGDVRASRASGNPHLTTEPRLGSSEERCSTLMYLCRMAMRNICTFV